MKTYTDIRTLEFLLFEVLGMEEILKLPRFQDHDTESVTMLINAVKDFSDKELYPYFREMDEHPAHYEDGEIIVHPQVKKCIRESGAMGLIAAPFDYDQGGMQLPGTLVHASAWIQECANNHLPNYHGLTQAAANLISHFGNTHLKETYFPRMLTGEWTGTMCLTEPQAGSSLSDITTTAIPENDHYLIQGQKIFISGGDFKGAENVVHLLLARIKGAPPGVKGISLFVVPKYRPDQGTEMTFNDVNTIGDFQKMGQKGYCTTHLSFGDEGDCRGWLVGAPHQGLKYMFLMMNEARIAVGRGAAAITMAAYQASLAYAKERPQGRLLGDTGKKNPEEQQTLIINHPDVKRMLLMQKAVAEGALQLVLLSAKFQDLSVAHPEASEREKYKDLLDLLTPVTKTWPAEKGMKAVSNGLQVFGGYGYCTDFILQQYFRDIRIFSIYEGTTGIQSLDLLGRKIGMKDGKVVQALFELIDTTTARASEMETMNAYSLQLKEAVATAKEVVKHLTSFATKGEYELFTTPPCLWSFSAPV
ncbi:acyl-CoA dehydrogenase family protein [Robertkochia flava]|uniref:acyl-CoA dehydrogenase family protein n=1 Tax=Robertkochia flava TaxID=3447986 RepID=UPI001CD003CA|nr:acyl-CoA dehydrogenase family protein [Robertkochia marina]